MFLRSFNKLLTLFGKHLHFLSWVKECKTNYKTRQGKEDRKMKKNTTILICIVGVVSTFLNSYERIRDIQNNVSNAKK